MFCTKATAVNVLDTFMVVRCQLTNGTTEIAYYNGRLNYSSEPGPLLDGLSYSCFKEVMMNEGDRV